MISNPSNCHLIIATNLFFENVRPICCNSFQDLFNGLKRAKFGQGLFPKLWSKNLKCPKILNSHNENSFWSVGACSLTLSHGNVFESRSTLTLFLTCFPCLVQALVTSSKLKLQQRIVFSKSMHIEMNRHFPPSWVSHWTTSHFILNMISYFEKFTWAQSSNIHSFQVDLWKEPSHWSHQKSCLLWHLALQLSIQVCWCATPWCHWDSFVTWKTSLLKKYHQQSFSNVMLPKSLKSWFLWNNH